MTTSPEQTPSNWKLMRDSRGRNTYWSLRQALQDGLYVLVGWPLHLVSFMVTVILLPLGLALAPFGIGIPILVAALGVAHGEAQVEVRLQEKLLDRRVSVDGAPSGLSARGVMAAVRQPERIGEIALSLLAWFPATIIWSVAFSWVVTAAAFLLAPLWGLFPGHQYSGLGALLHVPGGDPVRAGVDVLAGLVLVLLSPWAMRAMAFVQAILCTFLLEAPVRPVRAVVQEREQRMRLSAAQEAEAGAMRKLERNIHDGPQQRLVRLQLDIARAERVVDDPVKAREILKGARQQTRDALDELRAASRGIAPQVLVEHGLMRAVEEIAGRSPLPMRVAIDLPRLQPASETALYYLVSESVTNAIKHSGASEIRVTGTAQNGWAHISVFDDGVGGAHPAKGAGLLGLEQRLAAVGGRMSVHSPEGGPTTVEGQIPCK